jgi:hypothetical protein
MLAGDRIKTQNPEYKGLKSPHSARKEAAKLLKVVHQQEQQQKLEDLENTHSGQGQAGAGVGNN